MRFLPEEWLDIPFLAAVSLALTCLGFSAAGADQGNKDAQYVKNGRALFVQYCVSCHGSSGVGDGPVAPALKIAPDDLTSISMKYNGFPFDKILNEIDGEKASSAHGPRDMPVWGKRFRDSKRGEAYGFGDLYALTKYLQSIQKP